MGRKNIRVNNPVPDYKTKSLNIDDDILSKSPSIDMRYLYHSNMCINSTTGKFNKNKKGRTDFFTNFQKFIYDFSNMDTYLNAIKRYSSRNGNSKISNDFIKRIINTLPNEIKEYVRDELEHLHLKAVGKDIAVVHGFSREGTFYLVALDPFHEFDK